MTKSNLLATTTIRISFSHLVKEDDVIELGNILAKI